MKIAFLYEKTGGKISILVSAMEKVLSDTGFEIAKIEIDETGERTQVVGKALLGIDLIIIGMETPFWGGEISERFAKFIEGCPYIEGRKVAVFVTKKMTGSKESLKKIMSLVERAGGFLFDFEIVGSEQEAGRFGRRLCSIKP